MSSYCLEKSIKLMYNVLLDRGYSPEEIEDYEDCEDDIISYGKIDAINCETGRSTAIRWIRSNKLRTEDITSVIGIKGFKNLTNWILICEEGVTTSSNQMLNLINKQPNRRIDIWTMAETQYNILKHEFSPEYIVLTEEEKLRVIAEYKIKNPIMNMPSILLNDPVCRHFGIGKGTFLKIIRNNIVMPGEKEITYRCVR